MTQKKDIGPFNPPNPEKKWAEIKKAMEPFRDRIDRALPYRVQNVTVEVPESAARALITIGFDMGRQSLEPCLMDMVSAMNQIWDKTMVGDFDDYDPGQVLFEISELCRIAIAKTNDVSPHQNPNS